MKYQKRVNDNESRLFSINVEISESLKFLYFESICIQLSKDISPFTIICDVSDKKGMFVLRNSSEVKLREGLTGASPNTNLFARFPPRNFFYERTKSLVTESSTITAATASTTQKVLLHTVSPLVTATISVHKHNLSRSSK